MATVSTIGSAGGRNYSTPYSWAAAFASGGWEGDVYADSEINCTGLGILDFTSQSTSATNYILLTTGPSQSFIDNSSVQTNALKYNASNGAALKQPDYQQGFSITVDYVTVSKLQWNIEGPASQPYVDNNLTHCGLTQNIICMTGCNAVVIRGGLLANNLIYWPSATYTVVTGVGWYNPGAIYVNNTLAVCSDITNTATCFVGPAANNATYVPTVYNNAVFGFATYSNYTTTPLPGGYNGTSCSSGDGSTGLITSLAYGSQFVSTVSTAPDFRIKTGSGLIDAGYTATTYIPAAIDIVGTSRPQGSAWDIGAWELVTGGGGTTFYQSCLASTSPVASLGRGVSKQALGSTSSVAKLVRASSKAPRGSTSSVGTLSRRTAKTADGSTQSVASLKRSTAKTALSSTSSVASLSTLKAILVSALASTSSVASLKRSTGKVAKASTASVATIKRVISKTFLASTSTAATLAKSTAKSFKASSASVASAIVSRLGPTIAKLFEIFAAFSSAPLSASGAIGANTIQVSGAIIDPLAISAPFQSASVSASGSMNDDPIILQGEF